MIEKRKRIVDRQAMIDYGIENPRCEICNNVAVDIHHIVPKSQLGDDVASNFISLCRDCHTEAHKDKRKFQDKIKSLGLWNIE